MSGNTVGTDFVRLDGAVSAVRELHSKRVYATEAGTWQQCCVECRQAWPCATERAVAGALMGAQGEGDPS